MIATKLFPVVMAMLAGLEPVQSHGVMLQPQPYNLHTNDDNLHQILQVDPLGANYPFPCHGQYGGPVDVVTTVNAGQSVLVSFIIGADHHGGSCQFGVTYKSRDDPAFKDKASWKTIWTIIGGCPDHSTLPLDENLPHPDHDTDRRDKIQNCGNDHDNDCIREFNIPFPDKMPNGNASFAWTWFNVIGNREMYMNCAPVTVTGGSDNTTFYDSLPEMFVANVPGECSTGPIEGVLNIPNPGSFGTILEPPSLDMATAVGYNCSAATTLPTFIGIRAPSSSAIVASSEQAVSTSSVLYFLTFSPFPTTSSSLVTPTSTPQSISTSSSLATATVSLQSISEFPSFSASSTSTHFPFSNSTDSLATSTSNSQTISNSSSFSPSTTSTHFHVSTDSLTFASSTSSSAPSLNYTSSTGSSTIVTCGFVTSTKPTSVQPSATIDSTETSTPAYPTGSSGCQLGSFSCIGKAEGGLVCKDISTWGLCERGCALAQPVADGMKCENGQYVAARDIAQSGGMGFFKNTGKRRC